MGDYDQDGDPDLAITGYDQGGVTSIFRNDDGVFTDIHANLAIVGEACMAWGDYDNDGDLDLALMGVADEWQPTTRIYRNDAGVFTDIEAGLPAWAGDRWPGATMTATATSTWRSTASRRTIRA
jgi:hypothetical protein